MLLELLRLLLVVGLLVVLPGWLLLQAAFPPGRRRLSVLEQSYLTVSFGALLLIFVGVVLGLVPVDKGTGYFQTLATGFPHVEIAMALVCVGLAWVGLKRGAHPWLARILAQRALARGEGAEP